MRLVRGWADRSWLFQEGSREANVGGGVRGGSERGLMSYAMRGPPKEVNVRSGSKRKHVGR